LQAAAALSQQQQLQQLVQQPLLYRHASAAGSETGSTAADILPGELQAAAEDMDGAGCQCTGACVRSCSRTTAVTA
jgi:hypothetical protein